jgi:mannose-6-phosphate isomerase-like protein (cupin superfamily)
MYAIRKTDLPLIGSSYNFVGADHQNVAVSIFLLEAQSGRGAPLHVHEYDEIVIIQEGRSRFVAGDEIREAAAGDILVIKAHTPHGFVNIGEQVLKQVDIHHSPRFHQQNLEPTETSLKAGLPVNRAAIESASPR